MPSEAYWGGLGSWGLRRLDLSLAEYAKRAAAFGRLRPERDDDGNVTTPSVVDVGVDARAARRLPRCRHRLRPASSEAQLLADHIRQRHPGSLLAALCGAPELAAGAELPVGSAARPGCPATSREILRHARCFSELTVGPQHLYNVLLARKARAEFGWDTAELEARELEHLDSVGRAGRGALRGAPRLGR